MKTEAEIIQMGVDEILEQEKQQARCEEIEEQINSLEAELLALDSKSWGAPKLPKWQKYLADKINCAVEQAKSNR